MSSNFIMQRCEKVATFSKYCIFYQSIVYKWVNVVTLYVFVSAFHFSRSWNWCILSSNLRRI